MAARLDNAERRNRGRKEDSGGTVSGGGREVCIGARTRKQGHGFRVVDERRLATYPSLPIQQWPRSAGCNNAPRPRHFG